MVKVCVTAFKWNCPENGGLLYILRWIAKRLSGKRVHLPVQEMRVRSLSERSPEEGNRNLLQYSCLENSINRGARQAIIHSVVKSGTGLSN